MNALPAADSSRADTRALAQPLLAAVLVIVAILLLACRGGPV
jgi:hypothetical protein